MNTEPSQAADARPVPEDADRTMSVCVVFEHLMPEPTCPECGRNAGPWLAVARGDQSWVTCRCGWRFADAGITVELLNTMAGHDPVGIWDELSSAEEQLGFDGPNRC